ncbi:hypothetical protein LUTEI9C_30311 [Luteimonas sp. 9C]|nr:hypothetical protein LUTEI9C_30311 [Luteimonas sp. 9C]
MCWRAKADGWWLRSYCRNATPRQAPRRPARADPGAGLRAPRSGTAQLATYRNLTPRSMRAARRSKTVAAAGRQARDDA